MHGLSKQIDGLLLRPKKQCRGLEVMDDVHRTFLEENNPKGRVYLFYDEIQSIPGWEKWVKAEYDRKVAKTKFYISGSNTSMLSDNLSKLLTGRMLPSVVYPLSFSEYLPFKRFEPADGDLQKEEINHYLMEYLEEGGFPEAAFEKKPGPEPPKAKGIL